jgi:hypothetical protein
MMESANIDFPFPSSPQQPQSKLRSDVDNSDMSMHEARENNIICGEDLDRDLADLLDARYARSDTIPDQGHLLENDDDISLFGSGCTLPARTDRVSVTILVAVRDRSMGDESRLDLSIECLHGTISRG